jgi:hypothetical protein
MMFCFGRFPGGKFERFTSLYVSNYLKTQLRRQGASAAEDKPLHLAVQYDSNLHDFIANLRRANGNPEPHEKYGRLVDLFKPGRKFWVTKTASAFG